MLRPRSGRRLVRERGFSGRVGEESEAGRDERSMNHDVETTEEQTSKKEEPVGILSTSLRLAQVREDREPIGGKSRMVTEEGRSVASPTKEGKSIASPTKEKDISSWNTLVQLIRNSVVGDSEVLETPFGQRRCFLANYSKSGRALSFLERFLVEEMLPFYMGLQGNKFVDDAVEIVRQFVGGGVADEIVFYGAGAHGAVHALIDILGIGLPSYFERVTGAIDVMPVELRPVLFIGRHEQSANELMWQRTLAVIVKIDEGPLGRIDIGHLEEELERFKTSPVKIGSFSAAHNISGVVEDTVGISRLLHRHGALSFWDFSNAGPHRAVSMNPTDEKGVEIPGAHKDAVFMSPHKFIGGPGSPGLLVVKKGLRERIRKLLGLAIDDRQTSVDISSSVSYNGTLPIIGIVRCGLVCQLLQNVTFRGVKDLEARWVSRATRKWSSNENIRVIGDIPASERIGGICLTFRGLHFRFVATLLSDLFGIQVTAGCTSGGDYESRLLNHSEREGRAVARLCQHSLLLARPGWIRVDFPFFLSEVVVSYIIDSVDFVGNYGWMFVSVYDVNMSDGTWSHVGLVRRQASTPRSLLEIDYSEGGMSFKSTHTTDSADASEVYLLEANIIMRRITTLVCGRPAPMDPPPMIFDREYDGMIKFLSRQDCLRAIRRQCSTVQEAFILSATKNKSVDRASQTRSQDFYEGRLIEDSVYSVVPALRQPVLKNSVEKFGSVYGGWDTGYLRDSQGAPSASSIAISSILRWDEWIAASLEPPKETPEDAKVLRRFGFTLESETKVVLSSVPSNATLRRVYEIYAVAKQMHFTEVADVSADECVSMRRSDKVVLLDVRALEERRVSTIPDSIPINLGSSQRAQSTLRAIDEDEVVYVICFSTVGVRSGRYCKELAEVIAVQETIRRCKSKVTIRNLRGGIVSWVLSSQPLVDESGAETYSLHPFRSALEPFVPMLFKRGSGTSG